MVSARTRAVRSSFCPAALAHSASFNEATAASPHREVSFISVVGCGTVPSSGIRQNRRQLIESLTSAHSVSNPSPCRNFKNISRRYHSTGVPGRPSTG